MRLVFNAIPFERRARIDKGFKVCEEILRDGGNLVIFPEGRIDSKRYCDLLHEHLLPFLETLPNSLIEIHQTLVGRE